MGAAGTGVAGAVARPATLLAPAGRRRAPAFAQTGTAGRYVPYADLPGMAYFAADTPAARALVAGAPLGLVVGADGTLSVTPVAEAAAAADALQGQAPAAVGGLFSFWDSLWDDLKKGLARLERVVVTVARDVGLAIQYVKKGETYVFRAVVRGLEDVARAVAAFFLALGLDIVGDVLQALSMYFIPTPILAAQKAIENGVNDLLDSYRSDMINHVQPPVDTFLEKKEEDVAGFFKQIRNLLAGPASSRSRCSSCSPPRATSPTPRRSPARPGPEPPSTPCSRYGRRGGRTRSPTPSPAPGRCTS